MTLENVITDNHEEHQSLVFESSRDINKSNQVAFNSQTYESYVNQWLLPELNCRQLTPKAYGRYVKVSDVLHQHYKQRSRTIFAPSVQSMHIESILVNVVVTFNLWE